MLARRFTIVCLLVAVFGMSLAVLVAEKSRPARAQSPFPAGCENIYGPCIPAHRF